MALPINIEDLLLRNKVEGNRVEFKKGWNPTSIYHSICAFANDLDNLGGGYIIIGVEEENGMPKRPVSGIPTEQLDKIQQQMVGFNNLFAPYYLPRVSVEEMDGTNVVVIWAPIGVNRPYSIRLDVTNNNDKREAFYVRSGTSSIIAKGEVLSELRDMASRIPFDSRGNPDIKENDIDFVLIREYLQIVNSRMVNELKYISTMDLLERMDLLTGPTEQQMIKNVAAMMFCNHPEKFFPYTQISVVVFPEGKIQNPNRFSEKTFKGSVPTIIRGAMQYLKDVVIMEYVLKPKDRMQSERWFNYPYQALEESVVNAMYHRDYQEQQEVEITVEPDGIRILSLSGPDRSISNEALEECSNLHSRRYRNNRLGDFLKELDLTEGRCTGIPTIQDELTRNGSPRASIETDRDRSYFLMFIPVHEGCGNVVKINEIAQRLPKDCPKIAQRTLEMIIQNPNITIEQLSEKLSLSERTIKNRLSLLKKEGFIIRAGSKTKGYWVVNS
ncbi:MAG: putative DNA binding domain-containing protein [Bacteroides sp.]|jgi:ATP-dependent DNA helicase RecG|nr:putative DNA binding domain-containing protein [Bacteroides sp.]